MGHAGTTLKNHSGYDVTVFLDNGVIRAQKANGKYYSSQPAGINDDTLIQSVITAFNNTYIENGTYIMGNSFTGFTFGSTPDNSTGKKVTLAQGAILTVPNGYSGSVWLFSGGLKQQNNIIEGGMLTEAGTPQKLWTAWNANASGGVSKGILFNTYRNQKIYKCGTVINFAHNSSTDFINGNSFENIHAFNCLNGIVCADSVGSTSANNFSDIKIQCDAFTLYGVKNWCGDSNIFNNVQIWDATGSTITAEITSNAANTLILGGYMTSNNFNNASLTTKIIDRFKGLNIPIFYPTVQATVPSASLPYVCSDTSGDLLFNAPSGFSIYHRVNGANQFFIRAGDMILKSTVNIFQDNGVALNILTDSNGAGSVGLIRMIFNTGGVTTGHSSIQYNENLVPNTGISLKVLIKAGPISDSDFTNPIDGLIGFDTTNKQFYARAGGTWYKSSAFT